MSHEPSIQSSDQAETWHPGFSWVQDSNMSIILAPEPSDHDQIMTRFTESSDRSETRHPGFSWVQDSNTSIILAPEPSDHNQIMTFFQNHAIELKLACNLFDQLLACLLVLIQFQNELFYK